ncbi:MAG: aminotransferase class I/II-fold pyridoxal phosphate-dependent enzyme, partial [Deltaproteobacteria bacterium]|nr:aminotransferase class I/II-fold pyridoxal phosphate-dependent enzyme [Deltaproteobacteria bacterium]
ANIKAIEIVASDDKRRARLRANARLVREALKKARLDTLESSTHIIPILIGDAVQTVEVSKRLLSEGIFIQAIRPPTVADGTARLRMTVSSEHTEEELLMAVEKIAEVVGG